MKHRNMDQFDYHLVFKTLFVSHYRVFLVSMLKDVLDDVNNKYLMEQILKLETSYVILQQLPLFDIILLKLCSCINITTLQKQGTCHQHVFTRLWHLINTSIDLRPISYNLSRIRVRLKYLIGTRHVDCVFYYQIF